MIYEVIITTMNQHGSTHIAPMGVWNEGGAIIIAPFKPSATLENIKRNKSCVINSTDDVRIFAGCLTDHKNWDLLPTEKVKGYRLKAALSHVELELLSEKEDELRPHFYCRPVNEVIHKSFKGFNRAQQAVLELAILVSRLDMLPPEKIKNEIEYLSIAIKKTAGKNEKIAWDWLMKKIKEKEIIKGDDI